MTSTPKLGIPLISSQQSQPEVTHNIAMLVFQLLGMGVIDEISSPPASGLEDGDAYIIGPAPTGAWTGHDHALAIFFGGWIFLPGVDDDGMQITMGAEQEGLEVYSLAAGNRLRWSGSAWGAAGGVDIGTPPAIVQVKADISGGNSITLNSAPVNGNLLVCLACNSASNTAGSGWTKVADQTSGLDFGMVLIKTAGASESATQTMGSGWSGAGGVVMWELSSPGGTPKYLTSLSQAEQATLLTGVGPSCPSLKDCIGLSTICLSSAANSIDVSFNQTEDAAIRVGTGRQVVGGHSYATEAVTQMIATFTGSGSPSYKGCCALIAKH